MSFRRNIAPDDVIEALQNAKMDADDVRRRGGTWLKEQNKGEQRKPIVLGRSILEPIDEEARIRAREGRERVKTSPQNAVTGLSVQSARDMCGEGGSLFTKHNPRVAWRRFPILYSIDCSSAPVTDKTVVEAAVDRAFNTYNYAMRTIKNNSTFYIFKKVPNNDSSLAQIQVRWQYLDGALGNLGRCYYSWYSTGEMKSASINFDVADKWYISSIERCGYSGLYFDIESVACHEIGHSIGLAHNVGDVYATMYPKSKAGETLRRSLGKADWAALRDLYS